MHFISVLGTSNYQNADYGFNEGNGIQIMPATRFIQDAISQHHKTQIDKATVFLTDDARRINWEDSNNKTGLKTLLDQTLGAQTVSDVSIPDGANEAEIWQIFKTVYDAIDEHDELIIDVTHGFRSIPFILMAVIQYARVLKACSVQYIYYGAWDKLTDDGNGSIYAPVFDLLPMVEIIDWSHAASAFQKTGNATAIDDMRKRAQLAGSPLDSVARAMVRLSETLDTCRGESKVGLTNVPRQSDPQQSISWAAEKLVEKYTAFSANVANTTYNAAVALEPLLEHAVAAYKPLSGTNGGPAGEAGLRAAKWYSDHGMVAQGYIALHEAIDILAYEQSPLCQPGNFDTSRKMREIVGTLLANANIAFNHIHDLPTMTSEEKKQAEKYHAGIDIQGPLAQLHKQVRENRNDMSHFGQVLFSRRRNAIVPKQADRLSADLTDCIERAAQLFGITL